MFESGIDEAEINLDWFRKWNLIIQTTTYECQETNTVSAGPTTTKKAEDDNEAANEDEGRGDSVQCQNRVHEVVLQ